MKGALQEENLFKEIDMIKNMKLWRDRKRYECIVIFGKIVVAYKPLFCCMDFKWKLTFSIRHKKPKGIPLKCPISGKSDCEINYNCENCHKLKARLKRRDKHE